MWWQVERPLAVRGVVAAHSPALTLKHHSAAVHACVLFDGGRQLLSCSADSTLCVWPLGPSFNAPLKDKKGDILDGWTEVGEDFTYFGQPRFVLKGHVGPVYSCAMAAVSTSSFPRSDSLRDTTNTVSQRYRALSCGDDGTLRLWDVMRGEALRVLNTRGGPVHACTLWGPQGWWALSCSDGDSAGLQAWDLENRLQLQLGAAVMAETTAADVATVEEAIDAPKVAIAHLTRGPMPAASVEEAIEKVAVERSQLERRLQLKLGQERQAMDFAIAKELMATAKQLRLRLVEHDKRKKQLEEQAVKPQQDEGEDADEYADRVQDWEDEKQQRDVLHKEAWAQMEAALEQEKEKRANRVEGALSPKRTNCDIIVKKLLEKFRKAVEKGARRVTVKTGSHHEKLTLRENGLYLQGEPGATMVGLDSDPAFTFAPSNGGQRATGVNYADSAALLGAHNWPALKALAEERSEVEIGLAALSRPAQSPIAGTYLACVVSNVAKGSPSGLVLWDSLAGDGVEPKKCTHVQLSKGCIVKVLESHVVDPSRQPAQAAASSTRKSNGSKSSKGQDGVGLWVRVELVVHVQPKAPQVDKRSKSGKKGKASKKIKQTMEEQKNEGWLLAVSVQMDSVLAMWLPLTDADFGRVPIHIKQGNAKIDVTSVEQAAVLSAGTGTQAVLFASTCMTRAASAAHEAEQIRHALPQDNASIDTGGLRADLRGIHFVAASAQGCVVVQGTDSVSLHLTGCSIMNSYACEPGSPQETGAGLTCTHGTRLEVLDCVVHDCTGPGLYICATAEASLLRTRVSSCGGGSGGGIRARQVGGVAVEPRGTLALTDCSVHECGGPGVLCVEPLKGWVMVTGCEIYANSGPGVQLADCVRAQAEEDSSPEEVDTPLSMGQSEQSSYHGSIRRVVMSKLVAQKRRRFSARTKSRLTAVDAKMVLRIGQVETFKHKVKTAAERSLQKKFNIGHLLCSPGDAAAQLSRYNPTESEVTLATAAQFYRYDNFVLRPTPFNRDILRRDADVQRGVLDGDFVYWQATPGVNKWEGRWLITCGTALPGNYVDSDGASNEADSRQGGTAVETASSQPSAPRSWYQPLTSGSNAAKTPQARGPWVLTEVRATDSATVNAHKYLAFGPRPGHVRLHPHDGRDGQLRRALQRLEGWCGALCCVTHEPLFLGTSDARDGDARKRSAWYHIPGAGRLGDLSSAEYAKLPAETQDRYVLLATHEQWCASPDYDTYWAVGPPYIWADNATLDEKMAKCASARGQCEVLYMLPAAAAFVALFDDGTRMYLPYEAVAAQISEADSWDDWAAAVWGDSASALTANALASGLAPGQRGVVSLDRAGMERIAQQLALQPGPAGTGTAIEAVRAARESATWLLHDHTLQESLTKWEHVAAGFVEQGGPLHAETLHAQAQWAKLLFHVRPSRHKDARLAAERVLAGWAKRGGTRLHLHEGQALFASLDFAVVSLTYGDDAMLCWQHSEWARNLWHASYKGISELLGAGCAVSRAVRQRLVEALDDAYVRAQDLDDTVDTGQLQKCFELFDAVATCYAGEEIYGPTHGQPVEARFRAASVLARLGGVGMPSDFEPITSDELAALVDGRDLHDAAEQRLTALVTILENPSAEAEQPLQFTAAVAMDLEKEQLSAAGLSDAADSLHQWSPARLEQLRMDCLWELAQLLEARRPTDAAAAWNLLAAAFQSQDDESARMLHAREQAETLGRPLMHESGLQLLVSESIVTMTSIHTAVDALRILSDDPRLMAVSFRHVSARPIGPAPWGHQLHCVFSTRTEGTVASSASVDQSQATWQGYRKCGAPPCTHISSQWQPPPAARPPTPTRACGRGTAGGLMVNSAKVLDASKQWTCQLCGVVDSGRRWCCLTHSQNICFGCQPVSVTAAERNKNPENEDASDDSEVAVTQSEATQVTEEKIGKDRPLSPPLLPEGTSLAAREDLLAAVVGTWLDSFGRQFTVRLNRLALSAFPSFRSLLCMLSIQVRAVGQNKLELAHFHPLTPGLTPDWLKDDIIATITMDTWNQQDRCALIPLLVSILYLTQLGCPCSALPPDDDFMRGAGRGTTEWDLWMEHMMHGSVQPIIYEVGTLWLCYHGPAVVERSESAPFYESRKLESVRERLAYLYQPLEASSGPSWVAKLGPCIGQRVPWQTAEIARMVSTELHDAIERLSAVEATHARLVNGYVSTAAIHWRESTDSFDELAAIASARVCELTCALSAVYVQETVVDDYRVEAQMAAGLNSLAHSAHIGGAKAYYTEWATQEVDHAIADLSLARADLSKWVTELRADMDARRPIFSTISSAAVTAVAPATSKPKRTTIDSAIGTTDMVECYPHEDGSGFPMMTLSRWAEREPARRPFDEKLASFDLTDRQGTLGTGVRLWPHRMHARRKPEHTWRIGAVGVVGAVRAFELAGRKAMAERGGSNVDTVARRPTSAKTTKKLRAAVRVAEAVTMTRGTWPLLSDCRIWGNANVGIRIDGDFDGTVEGNTVELNAADGIAISLEAGGESYVWINYCIAGVSM